MKKFQNTLPPLQNRDQIEPHNSLFMPFASFVSIFTGFSEEFHILSLDWMTSHNFAIIAQRPCRMQRKSAFFASPTLKKIHNWHFELTFSYELLCFDALHKRGIITKFDKEWNVRNARLHRKGNSRVGLTVFSGRNYGRVIYAFGVSPPLFSVVNSKLALLHNFSVVQCVCNFGSSHASRWKTWIGFSVKKKEDL